MPVLVHPAKPTLVVGDQIDRDVLVAAHHDAMTFYREQCDNSWVPTYLRKRGLSEMLHAESRWAVGYSPAGWTSLSDHLHAAGYPGRVLEASGLACRSGRGTLFDRFRDRMMIPVHDPTDSAIVGFLGRANPLTGSTEPKYLNSPETPTYHKGKLLYGLVEGRPQLAAGARPVLVEGALDAAAITFAGQGRFVGLAPSGTTPTADHIALIDHAVGGIRHRGIVVAYDADDAGRQAAVRTHALIEGIVPTERALCLTLPKGSDPADLLRTDGPDALSDRLITTDIRLIDVVLEDRISRWEARLDTVEGRVGAVRDAARFVARVTPEEMTRQTKRLTDRLDLESSTVASAIADAITTADIWRQGQLVGGRAPKPPEPARVIRPRTRSGRTRSPLLPGQTERSR